MPELFNSFMISNHVEKVAIRMSLEVIINHILVVDLIVWIADVKFVAFINEEDFCHFHRILQFLRLNPYD